MTTVNLLPSDVQERQRTRRVTFAVGLVVAALIVLLGLIYGLQVARLSQQNRRLADQQAVNTGLQGQINDLSQFAHLKQQVTDAQNERLSLLSGQVIWSGALQSVSQIIPSQIFLTGMNGTVSQAGTSNLVGTIQFTGVSQTQPAIADWLTRLEHVTGWVNPWVSSIQKSTDPSGNTVYQFSGSVDLSTDATTAPRPL